MTGNNRRIMGCLAGLTFLISLLLTSSVHSVTAQEKPREARSAAKVTQASNPEESWHVIYIGNQRVGYDYGRSTFEQRGSQKVFINLSESHFQIKRFGQELRLSTTLRTEETETGDLLNFQFAMKNPPIQDTQTEGVVAGNELILTSTVAGRTEKRRVAWEAGAKSPGYPDRLLSQKPLKDGESLSVNIFVPEFNKFSKVTLTADGMQSVKLLDGKEHSLLKVKVGFSAIPENNFREFLDAAGRSKMSEIDMLGLVARTYEVSRDVALQAIAGAELDIAVSTLVRIDPPILDAHRKKRITYKITSPENSLDSAFVSGGTQQVKKLSANSIELTVTGKPLPPAGTRPVAADAKYLAPTRFLQANDPAVREHADRAAGGETDPVRLAAKFEKYVHDKLSKKNFSTAMASAAEVAQRMEGDCTEHAVLLAAMLRAKKVPSQVAAGLVYVESLNAFGGHMWTEAFLAGEWVPLDATLGRGGIGAAHLKMSESAMDEDSALPVTTFLPLFQTLGKLKIEAIKAE